VKPGVESHHQEGDAEGNQEVHPRGEEGKEDKGTEEGRPEPQNNDRSAVAVTESHEAVVNVILVGRGKTLTRGSAADKGHNRVHQRDPEDKDGDEQRGKEEEGHA
jgi:hypothetical protein